MATIVNHSIRRYLSLTAQNLAKAQVEGPSAVSGGHEGGYKVWRNIFYFVCCPAIAICGYNCYIEHQKHHNDPRPPFVKYEFRNIMTKRFPWADGQRGLFHNPRLNPLPDGYEDEQ